MTSVAVVNAYRQFTGTTAAAQTYFKTLNDNGYQAQWYQCVDTKDLSDYICGKAVVSGLTTPIQSLNIAANRLYFFPKRLRRLKEDLVFATDQVLSGLVDEHRNCIVVVHDLRELDPETWTNPGARLLYHVLVPKLKKAQAIFAVSTATKRAIESQLTDLPPIRVLHHGTPIPGDPVQHLLDSLRRIQQERTLNVLYISVDRPYKQIDFFLQLARETEKCQLTCDVKIRFHLVSKISPITRRNLLRNPIRSLRIYPTVPDLSKLFQSTDVLAFPSTMEGFGRPLAEAMQFGIPVIANDLEPMREVISDGGMLLPRLDLQEWTSALLSLTKEGRLEQASKRSATRGVWFSPASFATRFLSALHEFGY